MTSHNLLKELNIEEYLQHFNVNPTVVRILVLKSLLNSDHPLSLADIESRLETVDKSSISRTLSLFKKKHIVHFFNDSSGSVKYEICRSEHHLYDDTHAHFHCTSCGETICLHKVKIPAVELPENFIKTDVNYIISGLCPNCINKKSH